MAKKASGRERPNVVIYMMDTQGTRNMSCYGYRRETTPNIDALGREGVVYENHFVTGPWTLPSHASLFTGRYASGHGAGAQHEGLEPGLPSMAGVLRKGGYRTVALCCNSWAVDEIKPELSAGKDFEEHIFYVSPKYKPVAPYIPSDDPDYQDKGSLKTVGLATQWVDNHRKRSKKPFLMFINNAEPHDTYRPPEPFRGRFLADGFEYDPKLAARGSQATATSGDVCPTLQEWFYKQSLYDGSTACLDDRIGKFADELRRRGLLDNTIFIVTGDHGDVIGEQVHYAYHSQNGVWDHVMKTPLVIRYPKVFKAGTRCKNLVQINDVLPTLMELCGVKDKAAAASIQGESLLAALKKPTRDFALLEAHRAAHVARRAWSEGADPDAADPRFANVAYKGARTKRYKYVWASNGRDMLFDVVKDPDERWNIIGQKPEIAKKLQKRMEAKLMSIEQRYYTDMFQLDPPGRHDPFTLRRMAAWGLFQPGVVEPWDPKKNKALGLAFEKRLKNNDRWLKGRKSRYE